MSNPPPPPVPDDKDRPRSEAALGGADAVEKTTWVAGSGVEPERARSEPAPATKGATGTGPSTTWIIIAFLGVAAVLVYVLGFGR